MGARAVRLDLTTIPADKSTERRVKAEAYERCRGKDVTMAEAMAEVVREAVEAQQPGPTDAVVEAVGAAIEARTAFERVRGSAFDASSPMARRTAEAWDTAIDAAVREIVAAARGRCAPAVEESPDGEEWSWADRGPTR